MRCLAFLVCAIALAACTSRVSVSGVDLNDPATRAGIPYPLMFSKYEIEVTRRVIGCGPELKIAITADIKGPVAAPDPKHRYIIDPNSFAGPMKTSDLLVKFHPTGAVSSLNASVEDRTVQVVANVTSIALSIAKFAAIPTPTIADESVLPSKPKPDEEACTKEVLTALRDSEGRAAELEASTLILERRTGDLKAIQDKAVAMDPNVDEATKAALAKAYSALVLAKADHDKRTTALKKTLSAVVATDKVDWPRDGDSPKGHNSIAKAVLQRWMSRTVTDRDVADSRVEIALLRIGDEGRDLGKPDVVDSKLGIPFRQPVAGRLSVCRSNCDGNTSPIAATVGPVLQLGYIYYLPCESRPFTSIVCTYTMSEAGRLESIGTTQKAAAAEGLTAALKDVAEKAREIREVRSTARKKELEAETALLKAQAERDAAAAAGEEDTLKGDEKAIKALKIGTDLLNAERARIEAEIALEQVRSSRP